MLRAHHCQCRVSTLSGQSAGSHEGLQPGVKLTLETGLQHRHGACGGTVNVVACIEDPPVIPEILARMQPKITCEFLSQLASARGPSAALFL
jgi:hypothetical protein